MTRNNASKKAIRERMELTGEPYTVAARNLKKFLDTPINVIELGEDGDAWFVEGTTDINEAKTAIKTYLEGLYQSTDEWLPESIEYMMEASADVQYDWFWRPLHAQYPHDEAVLRSKSKHASEYSRQDTFTGIYIH